MTQPLHSSLGLTDNEADEIRSVLGREPVPLEWAMYGVMWSEHCSYKSTRMHLRRFPTQAPWVLVGPGENAGVVDVGDDIAVALRIESHNSPSATAPFDGAATGVGGILRDIFSMGARPIALMNPVRVGPLTHETSRHIADQVVAGASHYANTVRVPNVGGEVVFDETYTENPLVNVLAMGILPKERLVLARASGAGNLAILMGLPTGRDGVGGATVSSFGFNDNEETPTATCPKGNPEEERRLIEACLEMLDANLVVGIQDLGAAGITGATSETASNALMGMDIELSAIPVAEEGMNPTEIMTSETQERMLAIVEPDGLNQVLEICARWDISAAHIATVTPPDADGIGWLHVINNGEELAKIPATSLSEDCPVYDRPRQPPADLGARRSADPNRIPAPPNPADNLLEMIADLSVIYERYDHQINGNTLVGPGENAAILRLVNPTTGDDTGRGLALTTDGNHRWCSVDPREGSRHLVAESVLNLAVMGARPIAMVNCLNFGNAEHPEVMWQLTETIDGLSEACRTFNIPVIGGNVSLYNESRGRDIDPTPVIGVLGLVDSTATPAPGTRFKAGSRIMLLGEPSSNLAGSRWAFDHGERGGVLQPLDLDYHNRLAELVRALATGGLLQGAHDVSEGGIGLALSEMAVRSGVGFNVARIANHAELFSEAPSRVVIAVDPAYVSAVEHAAEAASISSHRLGEAGGDRLRIKDLIDVDLQAVTDAWRSRPLL